MNPQLYQGVLGQVDPCGFYSDVPWPDNTGQRAAQNVHQDRAQLRGLQNTPSDSDYWTRLILSLRQRPEPKLVRAQRIAAEVRANNPAMQVKRHTPV